jgi:hypothetical protein
MGETQTQGVTEVFGDQRPAGLVSGYTHKRGPSKSTGKKENSTCTWNSPHKWPNALGPPAPGVGVVAKGPRGWVKCEDRLPYYKDNTCSLPRPHDHDPTTHEADLGGGARRGPGPARVGLLGL